MRGTVRDLEISVIDWRSERGGVGEGKKKEKIIGRIITRQDVKEGSDVPFAMGRISGMRRRVYWDWRESRVRVERFATPDRIRIRVPKYPHPHSRPGKRVL